MPSHRYKCQECGREDRKRFPIGHSIQEVKCECGCVMRKVYNTAGNFNFEGSGFHKDYIKKEENEHLGRQARRARHLRDTGQVSEDEPIRINDKRVTD